MGGFVCGLRFTGRVGTKGQGAKELRTLSRVGEMMGHRILTSREMKTGRGREEGVDF